MGTTIEIWLIHPYEEMCVEFCNHFEGLPGVTVIKSRFEDLPHYDCFVTAGNSFGLMSGGVDADVVAFFGGELMDRIQRRIKADYSGEQPVGTAFIEPTGNPDYPFVAHAPTMRMPGPIDGTGNVLMATFAALNAISHHNDSSDQRITSVVFPALGTGFGEVPYSVAARQMATAYHRYLNSQPTELDQ